MIYFLKSPAGPIKIGTTIRLSQRRRQLATEHGPGLEVLAVIDGSFDVEKSVTTPDHRACVMIIMTHD